MMGFRLWNAAGFLILMSMLIPRGAQAGCSASLKCGESESAFCESQERSDYSNNDLQQRWMCRAQGDCYAAASCGRLRESVSKCSLRVYQRVGNKFLAETEAQYICCKDGVAISSGEAKDCDH